MGVVGVSAERKEASIGWRRSGTALTSSDVAASRRCDTADTVIVTWVTPQYPQSGDQHLSCTDPEQKAIAI
ncbi:hypothetical protein GCM10020369_50190 [Cryptosporangium minutisporangium]|uniref:Uncharacterized protein n=1 Tax=Cryptosporangium minutisporangium TaxID=113569 RepID=A0ABP6T4X3_9ACTN